MRLDQFSNPIFNEHDIFETLYKGQTLSPDMFVEHSNDIQKLEDILEFKFWKPLDDYDIPLEEYDLAMQADWFMPDEYKTLDIEKFLFEVCPVEHYNRLMDELVAFKQRDMYNLLRWLKYFVDTCRAKNIMWGVGRGSSVASYVLYLIGVHKIDSIKYNLDWQEFLR